MFESLIPIGQSIFSTVIFIFIFVIGIRHIPMKKAEIPTENNPFDALSVDEGFQVVDKKKKKRHLRKASQHSGQQAGSLNQASAMEEEKKEAAFSSTGLDSKTSKDTQTSPTSDDGGSATGSLSSGESGNNNSQPSPLSTDGKSTAGSASASGDDTNHLVTMQSNGRICQVDGEYFLSLQCVTAFLNRNYVGKLSRDSKEIITFFQEEGIVPKGYSESVIPEISAPEKRTFHPNPPEGWKQIAKPLQNFSQVWTYKLGGSVANARANHYLAVMHKKKVKTAAMQEILDEHKDDLEQELASSVASSSEITAKAPVESVVKKEEPAVAVSQGATVPTAATTIVKSVPVKKQVAAVVAKPNSSGQGEIMKKNAPVKKQAAVTAAKSDTTEQKEIATGQVEATSEPVAISRKGTKQPPGRALAMRTPFSKDSCKMMTGGPFVKGDKIWAGAKVRPIEIRTDTQAEIYSFWAHRQDRMCLFCLAKGAKAHPTILCFELMKATERFDRQITLGAIKKDSTSVKCRTCEAEHPRWMCLSSIAKVHVAPVTSALDNARSSPPLDLQSGNLEIETNSQPEQKSMQSPKSVVSSTSSLNADAPSFSMGSTRITGSNPNMVVRQRPHSPIVQQQQYVQHAPVHNPSSNWAQGQGYTYQAPRQVAPQVYQAQPALTQQFYQVPSQQPHFGGLGN